MRRIYLDHTATTPLEPRALEAMMPFLTENYGNPSSIHHFGQKSKAALDESREMVASLIGAKGSELAFAGSGTEADNFAVKGIAFENLASKRTHIITSSAEHHAVLESCHFLQRIGCSVTYLPVDGFGMIDPDEVRKHILPSTCLISVMHANNEVGTVNPVSAISTVAEEHGVLFHSDAVQSFGKLPMNTETLGPDLLSFSAHKIYGPKGIGALYVKKGVKLEKFVHGGGQERGRRAGTENVALAVGFARAAEVIAEERERETVRLENLRRHLVSSLNDHFPYLVFNGHPTQTLPHIINISFDASKISIDGEALLFNLDLEGIAVTSGSACTSGSIEPSHVLQAMGRDVKTAQATIRFSMGRATSREDLDYTVEVLEKIVRRIGRPV